MIDDDNIIYYVVYMRANPQIHTFEIGPRSVETPKQQFHSFSKSVDLLFCFKKIKKISTKQQKDYFNVYVTIF
jgi:hypothetical protein